LQGHEPERKAQDGAVSETWIDEADQAEIPLAGGDVTEGLVRVGATVRQPVGPHSPVVHAYLHFDWLGARGCHFDFSCWSAAVRESWNCLMLENRHGIRAGTGSGTPPPRRLLIKSDNRISLNS
jgi:hypothetical protein